ncbi:MAG: hypothetical protein WC058_08960 [Phycisphaeraceae bacterium]
MDAAAAPRCLLRGLNELKDPRVERTKHHSPHDIPIITILAVMKCRREVIGQANQLGNLGVIAKQRGNVAEASMLWTEAGDLYAKIGMEPERKKVQGWMEKL